MQHLTPRQAYEFLQTNPEAVFVDVRSEMEHMFVGHPKGSILVPWVDGPELDINPHFVSHVKKGRQREPSCRTDLSLRPTFCGCRAGAGISQAV